MKREEFEKRILKLLEEHFEIKLKDKLATQLISITIGINSLPKLKIEGKIIEKGED